MGPYLSTFATLDTVILFYLAFQVEGHVMLEHGLAPFLAVHHSSFAHLFPGFKMAICRHLEKVTIACTVLSSMDVTVDSGWLVLTLSSVRQQDAGSLMHFPSALMRIY